MLSFDFWKSVLCSKAYRKQNLPLLPSWPQGPLLTGGSQLGLSFQTFQLQCFYRSGFNLVPGLTLTFQPPASVFSCFILTPVLKLVNYFSHVNLMLGRNLDSKVKKWGESLEAKKKKSREDRNVHRNWSACSEWHGESGPWEAWPLLWSFGHTVSPNESMEVL